METRANSITPPDSILLGSSVLRGEGSASGKHPINKGRFYTRSSLLERKKTGRVGARVHAQEGHRAKGGRAVRRGLQIRGREGKAEGKGGNGTGDEEETEKDGGEGRRVPDRFRSTVRLVSRRACKYRTRVPQEGERLIGG